MLNIVDYPHRTFKVHPEHLPALNLYYDNSGARTNTSSDWSSAYRRTIEIDLGLGSSDNPIIKKTFIASHFILFSNEGF